MTDKANNPSGELRTLHKANKIWNVKWKVTCHWSKQSGSFYPVCVFVHGLTQWTGYDAGYSAANTNSQQDKHVWETVPQMSSNIGDRTFAVLLHRDRHVGRGNITLLTALLTNSRPAIAFVLLDNIQHLILLHHQCALIRACGHTNRQRNKDTSTQWDAVHIPTIMFAETQALWGFLSVKTLSYVPSKE